MMAHHTHTEIKPLGEFIHGLVDVDCKKFHSQSPMRPLSNIICPCSQTTFKHSWRFVQRKGCQSKRTIGPVEFIYRVIKHGDKAIGLLGPVMPAFKGRSAESKWSRRWTKSHWFRLWLEANSIYSIGNEIILAQLGCAWPEVDDSFSNTIESHTLEITSKNWSSRQEKAHPYGTGCGI